MVVRHKFSVHFRQEEDGLEAPDWNFDTIKGSSENGAVMAEIGKSAALTSNDIVSAAPSESAQPAPVKHCCCVVVIYIIILI